MVTSFDKDGNKIKRGDRVTTLDGRHAGRVLEIAGGWLGLEVTVQWDDGKPRPKNRPHELLVMKQPW
jgi:hypothetical protein